MDEDNKQQISVKINRDTWRDFSMLCVWHDIDKKDMLQSLLDNFIEKERQEGHIR